jgi:SPP1 gp7 family putative phage head morphogenesis protein
MADTSNEQIRDALIRRQTRLIRTATTLGSEMRALLVKVDNDLRVLIEERTSPLTGTRKKFGVTRTARLKALQKAIQSLQKPTYREIQKRLTQQLIEIGSLEAVYTADTITAALPVVVDLALPTSTLLSFIATSQPFQGKILKEWIDDLEVKDAERMMDQIRIGMVNGEGEREIGRRIFGTSTQNFRDGSRALTRRGVEGIARTAVNFITNQARQEIYNLNRALIPEDLYVATLDGRTTLQCMGLDGKRFKHGEGPVPPVHFGCRSLRVPLINGVVAGERPAKGVTKPMLEGLNKTEQRALIKDLTGQVPASQTYQVFLKKQSTAFQNDVLGLQKAQLFRKGGLTVDKFTDPRGKPFTLADLRRDHPEAFIQAGLHNND